jgi:predicted RNase H-like HicB family nuclease
VLADEREGGQRRQCLGDAIPEVPGVHSQGHTREEAREMVLSALSDWLRFYVEDQSSSGLGEIPADADTEPVHLTFAA